MVDSLKNRLSRARTSDLRIELLGKLSRNLMSTNIPEADKYAEQMSREAELSRDRQLMVKSLLNQGDRFSFFSFKKDFVQKSISYYNQALDLARKNDLDRETAQAFLGLSGI